MVLDEQIQVEKLRVSVLRNNPDLAWRLMFDFSLFIAPERSPLMLHKRHARQRQRTVWECKSLRYERQKRLALPFSSPSAP